ncbi:9482_t:CDS:2 [Gigaspora rosea]|nr:9482_t:CDS:2 [Gigaspora rosea]
MRYSKGAQEGNLFSPFIQNKVLNYVNSSKSLIQENKALQKKIINQLEHSKMLKKVINLKQLAESIAQFEHKRHQNISKIRAIACKPQNKEIGEIHINQIFNQNNFSEFFSFGIMVDESTRDQQKIFALCIIFWNLKNNKQDFRVLEMKDLANCSGKLVAQAIHDTLNWRVAFGKLPNISGFLQKKLAANLLYLAWDLHDGYDKLTKISQ